MIYYQDRILIELGSDFERITLLFKGRLAGALIMRWHRAQPLFPLK